MPDDKEVRKLNNAIQKAETALKQTFGDAGAEKYNSLEFFKAEGLTKAYQMEEVFTDMAKRLSSFGQEVRALRSSYLPVDFFKKDGVLTPDLSENLAQLESYENAFMRMLGMPQSDEIGLASGGATNEESLQQGSISYVKSSGEKAEGASANDITKDILDERAKRKADRFVQVNNFIFDIDKKVTTEAEEDSGIKYPKLEEFEDNPFAFSYLLFPPVQDSRFSRCINEPGKIVAPMFSNPKTRNVNGKKIKPTLLESVIRIRIDRLSGQGTQVSLKAAADSLVEEDSMVSIEVSAGNEEDESAIPYGESYGVIESLFIIRLRAAITGLAKKFSKDRDEIVQVMKKLVKKLEDNSETPNEGAANRTEWDELMQASGAVISSLKEKRKLEEQLLIEDSMMALLGDRSGVIDLQKDTQRNSSVYDAHLMAGLINIIDIPRTRLRERLSEIEIVRNENFVTQAEPIRGDINSVIGTDLGIGNLDMLVFSLALFSISEKFLLNLLSDSDYERLKETTLGDTLDSVADRSFDGRIAAVNELTDLIYAGYKIFAASI